MNDLIKIIAVFGLLLIPSTIIWITKSYLEANAFENITGKHVSTFDAMFVELRVDGNQ